MFFFGGGAEFISQKIKQLENKENKISHEKKNSLRSKVRGWVASRCCDYREEVCGFCCHGNGENCQPLQLRTKERK